jgi:hypothetical protein
VPGKKRIKRRKSKARQLAALVDGVITFAGAPAARKQLGQEAAAEQPGLEAAAAAPQRAMDAPVKGKKNGDAKKKDEVAVGSVNKRNRAESAAPVKDQSNDTEKQESHKQGNARICGEEGRLEDAAALKREKRKLKKRNRSSEADAARPLAALEAAQAAADVISGKGEDMGSSKRAKLRGGTGGGRSHQQVRCTACYTPACMPAV